MAEGPLSFKLAEPQIDSSIIELLEDMLVSARAGEIIALAGVTRNIAGEFTEFYSGSALIDHPMHFISYLRVLQMRFERQIPLDPPLMR